MTVPPIFTLREGAGPLIISIPHAGTYLPADIASGLTPIGQRVIDTDWHVDQLYAFAAELDVTILTATHSRTVVDLNRPPAGGKLYPGQAETGLCPTETFAGDPLYATAPPDDAEITRRRATYWQPYHDALARQLARLKSLHGTARLLDAHSIHGHIPRLFEGDLPDLNFGTNAGLSADPELTAKIVQAAENQGFSTILNGRFRGGYITRHYGAPDGDIHAIQLELAQRTYMDENTPGGAYDPTQAAALIATLRRIVSALLAG
jgi:N-formylglutamate deformylase